MKRTKILSVLLALMMTVSGLSCLSVVTSAAVVDSEVIENADETTTTLWELDDAGLLTVYEDSAPTWLDHASQIKKVVLDEGVTTIPNGAFSGCVNLTSVDTSKAVATLTYIGSSAFVGCDSLENIRIDAPLATIGAGAFQKLANLRSAAFVCASEIQDYAFYDCDKLVSVTIGGGLGEGKVGKNIFKSCDSLTTVAFGNGVQSVGYGMFDDCVNLSTATLPDSVVYIGDLAFENCRSLTNINIPDSVKEVGEYAFYDCVNSRSLYLGHSVEKFGEYVFGNNTSLETVTVKCKMPIISNGMFYKCSSLSAIELPQGVDTIGAYAFMGCTSLESFDISTTVSSIGESAFDSTALTSVNIPWNVVDIGAGVFTNCTALTEITVDNKNRNFKSVDGVLYNGSYELLVACPAGKTGELKINTNTAEISDDAFVGCVGLTVVEIPENVKTIAANAFNGCSQSFVIKTPCGSAAAKYAVSNGITLDSVHSDDVEWVETLAPTCTENGEKSKVCSVCNYVFETKTTDALGHEYDNGVITKKATCEEDGVVTFTCTRTGCGASYTEVLPKTNHKYNDGEIITPATCTEAGTKRFTCQNEGCYSYYDTNVKALGHSYNNGIITKAATCEEDGVMTYTCTHEDCNDMYADVIPATGHDYDDGVVTTAATCDEDGVKTFTCKNCGDSYTEVIPAIGHNYVRSTKKGATCKENGIDIYTCSNCGDYYELSTTGEHQLYSKPVKTDPTCTKVGKEGMMCAVCGQYVGEVKVTPATGVHTYKDGTCTGCGHNVKPQTPKMVSVKNEVNGVRVNWKAVSDAKNYRVYRRGAGEKWSYLTTVKGTTFLDENAQNGKYWRYTVKAVSENGLYSDCESGIYLKRVSAPKMKSVTNAANGISVVWNKVSGAKEYKIYRRGAGESWKLIATVKGTSYVDEAVKNSNGKYFRYTVRAVDGNYSGYESGLYTKRVATPHLKTIKNTSSGIKVTWNAVSDAKEYKVYRRGAGESWVYVTTVTGTGFVDESVKSEYGQYFRYTVRAVNGFTSGYESGIYIKRS